MLRSRPARLSLPASPLRRLRLVFLAAALGSLLLSLPTLWSATGVALAPRLAAVLATLALGAHWLRGYRREGFSALAELPEALVVALVVRLSSGEAILPLFAMLFRSLYGTPGVTAGRVGLYVGAVWGATSWGAAPAPPGEVAGRAVGILLAGGLMQILRGALERYEASERRLRSVVENSTDVAAIVGADLRVRWVGASVRRVLGHDPAALVGRALLDLVHPEDAAGLGCRLGAALGQPGPAELLEFRLADAAGQPRDVEAVVVNLLHDRHVEGLLLNLRDATERRRLEAERRALAEQRGRDEAARVELELLRERVDAQRERQELEARLQRSQRLESVGQLAGGVAHDFNNLLAIILNYAGFIREELPEGDGLRKDLREIELAAERGAGLTRQLLLFSQRKVSAPELLDLNAVVDELSRLLQRSLRDSVSLGYEQADELWSVHADPANLEQVLVNLVVNARDAVDRAGRVTVVTENLELGPAEATALAVAPGRYVRLSVLDDGCGMDELTLARAFEPFYTTKAAGVGTGLGLATVYGIAQQAGGCVQLESGVGAGTAVRVLLPAAPGQPARPSELAPRAEAPGTGERILVADDEASVRSLVERVLRKAGYEVETAASGEEALARCEEADAPFDLVLTDIVMPGLSGIDLAARLRARAPAQRILLMSGYSQQLLSGEGAELPPVLPKPFTQAALRAGVREALEEGLSTGAPASHSPSTPPARTG